MAMCIMDALYVCTAVYVWLYTHGYVCTVCMYIYIYAFVCVAMYIWICMAMYVCMTMYVWLCMCHCVLCMTMYVWLCMYCYGYMAMEESQWPSDTIQVSQVAPGRN